MRPMYRRVARWGVLVLAALALAGCASLKPIEPQPGQL